MESRIEDSSAAESTKPIHTLILDTGPLIKNDPSVSSLLASAQVLITHPSVIAEVRDEATRSRLETTLRPFLLLREPKADSVKFIQEFAKKSGDLQSLSRPDILLLALTYEVECERNGGDWRLRKAPGQKGLNGSPPVKTTELDSDAVGKIEEQTSRSLESTGELALSSLTDTMQEEDLESHTTEGFVPSVGTEEVEVGEEKDSALTGIPPHDSTPSLQESPDPASEVATRMVWGRPQPKPQSPRVDNQLRDVQQALETTTISTPTPHTTIEQLSEQAVPRESPADPLVETETQSDSDSDSWITPSNLSRHQARDATRNATSTSTSKTLTLQSALLTTDFAMQNVALLLNLNLLSSSLVRITTLRNTVQRCHACFLVMRPTATSATDKPKQFCPRCGLPTLTRVSCSTNASTGKFEIHLKRNMQWSNRGAVFSIPKPTAGSSSGLRNVGGGKGGWGNELLLAEDQKEYVRAVKDEERRTRRERDLMGDEFLSGLLGGGKGQGGWRAGGRVKVGAGRDVNSKKRK